MKNLYLFGLLLFTFSGFSQQDAWVYFNDKPSAQAYFDNPLSMLNQRSLDRRTAQNIPLDINDIPIEQSYVNAVSSASGITVMAKSKWLNAVHVRGGSFAINALSSLAFVSEIDFADNSLNNRMVSVVNNTPLNKTTDAQIVYPYGNSANQIQMLNGHLLHEQDYTGTGKIIAVLDAGFPQVDVVQPFAMIRDNNQILGGYNFVAGNDDFYSGNSHGTLVLSTMGGYTANQLVGTAPGASYYLYITEDIANENPVEESYWVEAAETADSLGVDIINTSLGYFDYDNPAYSYSFNDIDGVTSFISRGADIAFSRGMVVVVSAGNSGSSGIGVPADAVNVLTVGAVTPAGNYANFSSIGPTADGRIKPDVMAQGQAAVLSNTNGNIVTASGTSFSGPIIAGMVASFWQSAPSLTNTQVVQLIKQSASLYNNPNNMMGYGIPNFQQALDLALLSVINHAAATFVLFPNPVIDTISITWPDGQPSATLTFYNGLGNQVMQHNVTAANTSVDLKTLTSGIYFYKIVSAIGVQSGKLIKS